MYYYNEKSEQLERIGGKVEGNTITVTVKHFSTYGVFYKVQTPEKDNNNEMLNIKLGEKMPKTATNNYNWLVVGGTLLLIAALIVITSKSRFREKGK